MEKRNVLIVTVIAALIFSLIFISGCTTPGQKDGKTVLINAIKNSKTVISSEVAYDAAIGIGSMTLNMKTNMWINGNISRVDINGTILGFPMIGRFYKLQNGDFSCTQTKGEWICNEEATGTESITGLAKPLSLEGENEAAILQMVLKGVLVINPAVTENTYAGRTCDRVEMLFNVTKLSEVSESMGDSELIKTVAQMRESNVSDVSIIECLDQSTGDPLYSKMATKAPSPLGTGKLEDMTLEMTATKYIPNAAIADEIFQLPAEVSSQ